MSGEADWWLDQRDKLARHYQRIAFVAAGAAGSVDELACRVRVTDRLRVLGPDHPDTLVSRNNLTRAADPLGRTLLELFDSGDPFSRHDSVLTDTYLAAAIRADTYATHIAGALAAGTTVIEDRGLHTIYSFSLAGLLQKHRTAAEEAIGWLRQVGVFAGPAPDRSVWLRLPPDDAIARAEQRQGHPYTDEQRAFLRYVHDAYTALADTDPGLRVVDVSGLGTDEAHQAVLAAVADLTATTTDLTTVA